MGRRRHVVVFSLLLLFFFQLQLPLLILSSTATHGRSSSNAEAATAEEEEEGVGAMMRQTLGSRPPSCEGQCQWWCGGRRCEAVQVPVTPHDLQQLRKKKASPAGAGPGGGGNNGGGLLPSSYDDHSNYKPLGWRCNCLHS